jgi:hypothetical protein
MLAPIGQVQEDQRCPLVGIVLQNSFWITENKFSGLWALRSIIVRGTTATSDELTGNSGSALEDILIGDFRLVSLFAKNAASHFRMFCNTIGGKADLTVTTVTSEPSQTMAAPGVASAAREPAFVKARLWNIGDPHEPQPD